MENKHIDVSVIVPVFNEEANIRPLYEEIAAVMDGIGRPYEIVLINDGSTDGGPVILAGIAATDERCRAVQLPRNRGQSAALAAGFRAAAGEVIVTLDGDGQNDPADIPALLEALRGADLVCGYRSRRHDTIVRRMSSRIAWAVRNAVLHDSVRDTGCSLKAFRRTEALMLPTFNSMHRFIPALFRMAGFRRIVQVPVHHRPRTAGRSKYGIGNRLWKGVADLFVMVWMGRNWIFLRDED